MKIDLNTLKDLYRINSHSGSEENIKFYIQELLENTGIVVEEDTKGNLYITKGIASEFPCFVAHLDEVHYKPSRIDIVELQGILFGFNSKTKKQVGIGADDKNGIYTCLKMIEELPYVKVAFFVEEETGCQGSRKADITFFEDCRWIIQIDRKDSSDIITKIGGRDICNKHFKTDICKIGKEFEFKPTFGMMTDVDELIDNNVGISCINISCGYYFPHTDNECTVIKELENTIEFCKTTAETLLTRYPHKAEKKTYGYGWGSNSDDFNYFTKWKKDDKGVWHKKDSLSSTTGIVMPKKRTDFDSIPCNNCKLDYDCTNCNYYRYGLTEFKNIANEDNDI